ncbi:hypothetical protein K438DRAFT_1958679 [Mycena galopus ATCC 62051]|nr:hypothetical protein K438DRAFT_1958679 [Mycena galopus ATCC 62051]
MPSTRNRFTNKKPTTTGDETALSQFTGRTSKKRNTLFAGNPTAPTPDEWEKMTPYGSFTVEGDKGQQAFVLGDTATILPSKSKVGAQLPLHKYWLAKILAIRARHQPKRTSSPSLQIPDVWVSVKWFYSPTEISSKIKGFNSNHCSQFERISSDHTDLISALTFEAPALVLKFHEDNPDQHPIPESTFFSRYFLETTSDKFKLYVLRSSVHSEDLCLCHDPYNVRDKDTLRIMHMCPRPSCRRFYHRSCLLENGHWGPTTDPLLRLLSSPDTDQSEHLRCTGSIAVPLPPDLLTLAVQPIVRGAAALPSLGITGNSCDVVYARRLVYGACQGTPVPDVWRDHVDLDASLVESYLHPIIQLRETDQDCTIRFGGGRITTPVLAVGLTYSM